MKAIYFLFSFILLIVISGCVREEALAGEATQITQINMQASSMRLSFPSASFDPSRLYYDVKAKKICYEDIVGNVCESKPTNCKYDAKSKSYSCKLQVKLNHFFPYTNLIFKTVGGKGPYICLPCLSGINPTISRTCGNNILDSGEQCDDGNQRSGDGCTYNCQSQVCGNSIVESPSETCDDGNVIAGDGCSNLCVSECALASSGSPNGVRTIASYHCPAICGNGVLERGEACDGGFSCSASCTPLEPRTCYGCVEGVCGGATVIGDSCGILYDSIDSCDASCRPDPAVVEIPPSASDVDLCEQPDPFDLPEGTRFRDYEDARHISVCEPEDSPDCTGDECARYIICGRDGTTTVSVEPCPEGVSCEDGACVDDPRWDGTCFDTDGGADADTRGATIFNDGTDERVLFDHCGASTVVWEQICSSEGEMSVYLTCGIGEYCENDEAGIGACVLGTTICSDSDGGINAEEVGTTTITNREGVIIEDATDDCEPFTAESILEFSCVGNNIMSIPVQCDVGEHCEDGLCVTGEPFTHMCEDSDGGRDIYESGNAITTRSDGQTIQSPFDICWFGSNTVREAFCVEGIAYTEILPCPDDYHCQDGACIEGCSCSRTGATDTAAGYITGNDCVIQPDICEGDLLHVFRCNAETGLPETVESVVCDSGCTDGLCN